MLADKLPTRKPNIKEIVTFLNAFISNKFYYISTPNLILYIELGLEEGLDKLVFDAIKTFLKKDNKAFGYLTKYLFRLGKYKYLDDNYEKIIRGRSKYEEIPSEVLADWALYISKHDLPKSKMLITIAYKNIDKISDILLHNCILDNYIMIKAASGDTMDQIKKILVSQKGNITSTTYFNLGSLHKDKKNFREGLKYYYLALSTNPDKITRLAIAECLFYLDEHYAALEYLDFLKDKDDIKNFKENNGIQYRTLSAKGTSEYIETRGKLLKGRIYLKGIDREKGIKFIKESFETEFLIDNQELRNEVENEIGKFQTKDDLKAELVKTEGCLKEFQYSIKLKIKQNEELNGILGVIKNIQGNWAESLDQITDEVQLDQISNDFSSRLRAFHNKLLYLDLENYNEYKILLSNKYNTLSSECIESLTNAHVLFTTLKSKIGDKVKIYSGVTCELTQAIEVELNNKIVKPFEIYYKKKYHKEFILYSANGKLKKIFLFDYSGNPKHLLLYEIETLITSDEFRKNCKNNIEWIITNLPKLISKIRTEYRNGFIHQHKASSNVIDEYQKYLHENDFFEIMNEIKIENMFC
jgi:hypothetical protein